MYLHFLKHHKLLYFVGGAVTAAAGSAIAKNPKTKELCVKGLAKGIKLQKDAQEAFQNMREEAEDLCFDAKQEAASCSQ